MHSARIEETKSQPRFAEKSRVMMSSPSVFGGHVGRIAERHRAANGWVAKVDFGDLGCELVLEEHLVAAPTRAKAGDRVKTIDGLRWLVAKRSESDLGVMIRAELLVRGASSTGSWCAPTDTISFAKDEDVEVIDVAPIVEPTPGPNDAPEFDDEDGGADEPIPFSVANQPEPERWVKVIDRDPKRTYPADSIVLRRGGQVGVVKESEPFRWTQGGALVDFVGSGEWVREEEIETLEVTPASRRVRDKSDGTFGHVILERPRVVSGIGELVLVRFDSGGVYWTGPENLETIEKRTAPAANPKDALSGSRIPLWLLSPVAKAHWAVAQFLGAVRYGTWNWRAAGVRASVYASAGARHFDRWLEGEEYDVDGQHNLGAAMACAAILLDARAAGKLIDDRPPTIGLKKTYAEVEGILAKINESEKDKKPRHWTIADTDEIARNP